MMTKIDNTKGEMDKSAMPVGEFNTTLWMTERIWTQN